MGKFAVQVFHSTHHQPFNPDQIKLKEIVHNLNEKAIDRPDEKPLLIMASAIENHEMSDFQESGLTNLRKIVYRTRRKVYPKQPKNKSECIEELRKQVGDGNLIKNVKGKIVMLAREEDLKLLNSEKLELYADGTFKFSPRHFKQMYSFFVVKDGFYIPIAHFLLQNKTKATYKKVIKMLKSECTKLGFDLKQNLKHGSIMIDFEHAMKLAIEATLDCKIRGCRFHLGQSWWRNIKDKGLAPSTGRYSVPRVGGYVGSLDFHCYPQF